MSRTCSAAAMANFETGGKGHPSPQSCLGGIRRLHPLARLALAANKEAIEISDAFYATDVAFHRVLYTIGGNPIFPAIHEGFVSWLAPHWARMDRFPEHNARIYEAHEAIYQAILERDTDAAEAALQRHFNIAWEFVKSTFGKRIR